MGQFDGLLLCLGDSESPAIQPSLNSSEENGCGMVKVERMACEWNDSWKGHKKMQLRSL